jgi:hypothetical protein
MGIKMHLPPIKVKRIQVIFVAALRGDGSKENPERTANFYYDDNGELLACYDPINGDPDTFFAQKKNHKTKNRR